jgi:hypothetical protein
MTRSAAIRTSLLEAAQKVRHHDRTRLAVSELAADKTDRKEMLEIAKFMGTLH